MATIPDTALYALAQLPVFVGKAVHADLDKLAAHIADRALQDLSDRSIPIYQRADVHAAIFRAAKESLR